LSADSKPVRLGIVGTGFISAVHRACALASADVELVAVASARGRATRDRVGPLDPDVALLTIAELVASDTVDAVLVCTRTRDHADHAVAVLAAGKHLLLEKPGAISLADHGRIEAAAAAHPGQVVRVAYHRRHDPGFCEFPQPLCDDIRACTWQSGKQIGEALGTQQQVPHDQQGPALAHHIQRLRDRAPVVVLAFTHHDTNLPAETRKSHKLLGFSK